ncbi:MAG: hypothetical protein HEQ23_09540 [Tepidisphaera sp.]
MIAGLFQHTLASTASSPSAPVGGSRLEHLYLFGGIAIGFLLGLLIAAAAWSILRRSRRQAEMDERQKRRLKRRIVGQGAWAEAADRLETPTAEELDEQHGDDEPGERPR